MSLITVAACVSAYAKLSLPPGELNSRCTSLFYVHV